MTENSENHEEIRQYLLGSLSEEVRQRIEERLMSESSFLKELEVFEEELIDDYVSDDLEPDSRARFEQHFLCTPERRDKVRFAVALDRYTSQQLQPAGVEQKERKANSSANLSWSERLGVLWNSQGWAFRSATAALAIAIIVVALWLVIPRKAIPTTFANVTLSISASDRAEGAAASKVDLPLNADALRISLKLPEAFPTGQSYRVELLNNKGSIKKLDVENRDAQSVTVVIPADQLSRGEYALRLFIIKTDGTEQRVNGNYFFTVQ